MKRPHADDDALTGTLTGSRLRAWRLGLLALHRSLIDAERRRYERAHGPIEGPHHALRLLMHDPEFAWLRPLADLIVRSDERLADDRPVDPAELEAFAEQIRRRLQSQEPATFGEPYRRALQDEPDVVVFHGRLLGLLDGAGLKPGEIRLSSSDHSDGERQ